MEASVKWAAVQGEANVDWVAVWLPLVTVGGRVLVRCWLRGKGGRTVEKDNITLLSTFDFVWLEYGRAVVCGVVAYSDVPLLDGVRGGRACEERGGL